jgi:hypothetical protein
MSVTSAVKRNASATRWKRSKPLSAEADRLRDKGTESQRHKAEKTFFYIVLSLCSFVPLSLSFFVPMCLCTFVPALGS